MHIPSYQIYNILKVYSKQKQLKRNEMVETKNTLNMELIIKKINRSSQGRRQSIIDKVAADIIARITHFGQDENHPGILNQPQKKIKRAFEFKSSKNRNFTFNIIEENNQKTTNELSVEDSSFFTNQLEQSANEAVEKNIGS